MGTLGIPIISNISFPNTERGIGQWWKDQLEQLMLENRQGSETISRGKGRLP